MEHTFDEIVKIAEALPVWTRCADAGRGFPMTVWYGGADQVSYIVDYCYELPARVQRYGSTKTWVAD